MAPVLMVAGKAAVGLQVSELRLPQLPENSCMAGDVKLLLPVPPTLFKVIVG